MDRYHLETDRELAALEDEIRSIYARSASEIEQKWREHMDMVQKRAAKAYDKYLAAKDAEKKAELLEDYKRILRNATLQNERYAEMIGDVTERLAKANEVALDCANGVMPKMYTINYNGGSEGICERVGGYSFTLCDENTVRYLAGNDKLILPKRRLDVPKDEQWNTKKLNAEVLQGIIQGESVGKIADRVQSVTDANMVSAVRAARTMTTGAENKGRLDSYRNAERMGIKLDKRWMSTLDGRTRHAHRLLDGQIKPNDKPFEVEGRFIMYPGDPSADASLVYNCRCTMVADIEDVPDRLSPEGKPAWADGMSDQEYAEWKYQHTLDISDKSAIIDAGSDNVAELIKLGRINIQPLEKEFGKLLTDEIIITNERIEHIKLRHPDDYKLFEKYGVLTVENPDVIIKDCKNKGTVFLIKKLPDTNLNVVARLVLDEDDPKLKNSIMTFYRIRNKNLVKLENKNKTLYKKE